jgi:16S rRNA (guanine(966)-N(2))-methyltransferase RsmD
MRIIAGTARNRRLEAPEGTNTRPTLDRVRENLFNILQTRIRDSTVLDLFAGSGALSFEAISRGAVRAVLCDADRKAYRTERRNAESLGFSEQAEFFCCDWRTTVRCLKERNDHFDLVFLDPPYCMNDLRLVSDQLIPLLADNGMIIVEHEAGKEVLFGSDFEKTDERKWGFCGMSFYRKKENKPVEKGEDE